MAAVRKAATEELTLFEKLRKEVNVPAPLKVTDDIVLECPTKAQLDRSNEVGLSEEDSNRILLGEDNYDKLQKLFGDEALYLWAKFHEAYIDHFFERPKGQ